MASNEAAWKADTAQMATQGRHDGHEEDFMTYEEEVEGWEDSVLCGYVAMRRRVREWLREPLALLGCLAAMVAAWAYMLVLMLACSLVWSL